MSTLTKLPLAAMGKLRPKPAQGCPTPRIELPAPDKAGGLPLMQALTQRRSVREFAEQELPLPNGVNRADGRRTTPAHRHDAAANALTLVAGSDVRCVTFYRYFVDQAALDLVHVAGHGRMTLAPVSRRQSYAAGAIAQTVHLFAACNGLATVIGGWIDRDAIADALGLSRDRAVLLSQAVGLATSTAA